MSTDTHADYRTMPPPADEFSGPFVLAHAIDSAGFRYYWATEGMPSSALPFAPASDCMSLEKLLEHMSQLAGWMLVSLPGKASVEGGNDSSDPRAHTLACLAACSANVRSMSAAELQSLVLTRGDDTLPIWNILNGPVADFLTHVGQVATWRRLAGCPAPAPRYLDGLGPADQS